MFKITTQESYILVKFSSAVYFDTVRLAVHSVVRNDQFGMMYVIIVFDDLPVFLRHDQLNAIVKEVEAIYPRDAVRKKTALVITSGFGTSLAEIWIQLAHRLPPTYEIFARFEDAEAWVMS